jgi:hypothetical protein
MERKHSFRSNDFSNHGNGHGYTTDLERNGAGVSVSFRNSSSRSLHEKGVREPSDAPRPPLKNIPDQAAWELRKRATSPFRMRNMDASDDEIHSEGEDSVERMSVHSMSRSRHSFHENSNAGSPIQQDDSPYKVNTMFRYL